MSQPRMRGEGRENLGGEKEAEEGFTEPTVIKSVGRILACLRDSQEEQKKKSCQL